MKDGGQSAGWGPGDEVPGRRDPGGAGDLETRCRGGVTLGGLGTCAEYLTSNP